MTIPTTCCTSIEARDKSLLASRRSSAGLASVPRSRSVVPSDWASQAATSIADQSCSTPPNGVTIGPVAISPAPDEHSDIAGRALEDNREILVGMATLEELRGGVEKHEIDVVLGGESHGVRAWLARGVGGYAGRDALLRERVSAFGERGARGRKLAVIAQEPSQDELARGPSSERLGDRKEVIEALRVGCDDQDRALSRRRGRRLRGQVRIMAKDRLLELLQGRARLDAELLDEQPPRLAIDLERLDLATRAVERPHERRSQPFAERMLADERLDLADQLCEATEREVGFDPPLERRQAELFEAESLRLRERFVREVGERRSAPEVESFAKPSRGQLGRRLLRLLHQQLEAEHVELVRTDADHVARLLRDDHVVRSERLAEL